MRSSIFVTLFASLASAVYVVQDDYTPSKFVSMFDFFTGSDPTNGYVNYIDGITAQYDGLLKVQNNQVYMGVDNTSIATGRGRDSIRISSKNSYNHGLFILDLAHMPGGQCGSWPAFWLLGPNWPNSGELDIIEGVNSQKANTMALHTNSGCSITNSGQFSGTLQYSNCDTNAADQPSNTGCSIASKNDQSYGTGFNAVGGGVYATEWTSDHINIWFFPRSAIPADITSGNPDPSNWGLAMSSFSGACDLDKHVMNQQIVFDITFCGSWAGQVWSQDATCSSKAATCQDFVQNNPGAFNETYWEINSLKVYQQNGAVTTSRSTSMVSTSTVVSTTQTTVGYTTVTTSSTFSTVTVTTVSSNTPAQSTTSTAVSVTSISATTPATTLATTPVTTPAATPTTTPATTPAITPAVTSAAVTTPTPGWNSWWDHSNSNQHSDSPWTDYKGSPGGRWGGGGRRRRT